MRSVEYRFTRVFTGIRRPRRTIFGSEFGGRVEEVGGAVTEFRIGDEVFGVKPGASAEYVAVPERGVIALKPSGLMLEEAAAVPDGSLLALTCRDRWVCCVVRTSLSTAALVRSERRPSSCLPTTSRLR